MWKPPHKIGDPDVIENNFFLPTHCVIRETMGMSPHKQTGRGRATRNSPPLPAGNESLEPAGESWRTLSREEQCSCSRSDHCCGRSPLDPKQGGPFKILPFEPKEMRSDTFVFNFEHAVDSYFKGAPCRTTRRETCSSRPSQDLCIQWV